MSKSTGPFILFLGPQGSGKGTQLDRVNQQLKLPVIVMGELLRTEAARGTSLGQRISALIDQGKLVTIDLWEAALQQHLASLDLTHGLIADGLLRTLEQVRAFERIQQTLGLTDPLIINIELPREESIRRLLKRGRHDDTLEAITQRLQWSEDEMRPVIDHYRTKGTVVDINGDQSRDEVYAAVSTALMAAGVLSKEHNGAR